MKHTLIGLTALVLMGSTSFAADLSMPESSPQPFYDQQPISVPAAGGWYLRGDGFYGFNKLRGANFFQGSNGLISDFDTAKVDNSFGFGGGAGYQMTNMLRADLTADYMFETNFKGSTSGQCGDGSPCTSRDLASFTAISLLANAYVDLGTYNSITPYVGAGIGGTKINWSDLSNTSCSDHDPSSCDPTVTHDGKSSWRFTYALMAGASVDLTCNVKADAGYRYRHIEGGDMFGYRLNGGPGYDKGFDIHEGRVGLRYTFGGACQQPDQGVYLPPPPPPGPTPVYK
jgi:opacity protein-like surface antigen